MATNPWDADPVVVPADPSFTGVIPGAPKPKDAPSGYRYKADGTLEPIPGGPADPNKDQPSVGASSVTGNDYLKTLDPGTGALVKALAEGRKAFPAGSALRSPYWQEMLTHVSNYDPGFDEVNYTSRAATRRDFTSGKAANNIRALNTAIGHLGHLEEQVGGTASHGFVPLNVAENAGLRMFGDPGPTNFDATVSALAGELTAVYRGAGGAEADINRYIQQLSPNASKDQKEGTIRNIVGLLKSRLDALNDQYRQGMGTTAQQLQLLDPQAQLIVHRLGGFDAAGAPQGGDKPPTAAAAPLPNGSGGGDGGDSGPTPPGLSDLSGDQKQAYSAFLAANPKPDGPTVKTFLEKLTGKTVTNADEIAAAIRKGAGVSTTVEDKTEQQKVADRIAQEDKSGLADDPLTTLVRHGATLNLSDEAAGVGNAAANLITSPLTGNFDPVGAYRVGRDVERERIYDARNALGYAAAPIEFVGGLASASPGNALAALDNVPALIRQGAKAGAVGGGVAGFGAGEGAQQSIAGAAAGAAGGAAVGAAAPYVVNRITANNALANLAPEAADVARAGQAEGVDILRPMVDPAARGKFGALESAPGSQNVVREGVDRVRGQIEGRVADLGDGGTALEPGAAGERLQVAGNRYIERSRGIKNRLYSAAENAGGATRFVPQKAIDQADQEIAALGTNPQTNAGEIRFLQGIRDDLAAPGGKTVAEIRNIRTGLRGAIGNSNLTMSGAEARANSILSAAGDDIAAAIPEAGRLYKRADAFYRERQTVVDDIKRSILGQKNNPLDPQTAFQNIKTLSSPGGNLRRLSAVTRYLEPDERADVAATVASTLGRKAQDAPFSSDLLLSQTDKMSPAAIRTIFGPEGADSIANLRLLSQKLKEGVGDLNRSKTANSMWRLMANKLVASLTGLGTAGGMLEGGLSGGLEAGAAGALTGAAVQGVGMVRNILSARAMVNPRLSQWLIDAAGVSTPSQAKQAVRGLSLVISREPALAHELTPIRDFLNQRVTQLLAANPKPDDGNNEQ
jgi:hypothetical protein